MQYRINRAPLVALLAQWERDMPEPARHDVAERLSQWLGPMDAVRLNAALHTLEAPAPAPARRSAAADPASVAALYTEGVQALQALVQGLLAPEPPARGRAARLPALPAQVAVPPVFAAQHKRYLWGQQQLGTQVAQLRARLRQALARVSAPLQQLAALDEVMEQMLAPREQRLWAGLLVFLERRWQVRCDPAAALPALGQRAFEQDMAALLSAELALRLQPLTGLVEAARTQGGSER